MTATQAAWVAGFFDGEGTISVSRGGRGGKYQSVYVSIVNTHKESIETIYSWVGAGRFSERDMSGRPKHHKQQYLWKIAAQRDVVEFCKQILPYLIVKKEKVQEFLNGWEDLK